MIPALDAHGNQRAGEGIHIVAELRIGSLIIQFGIVKANLIGELLHHAVEHLRKGQVDQLVVGPDILPLAGVRGVELAVHHGLIHEGFHVVDVLRENHARVVHIAIPVTHPFKRDIAFVIDGAQRHHHVRNGQITVAHQPIDEAAVLDDGVFDMDVFDIGAEILQRLLRGFMHKAVRVMHIPKRRHVIGRKIGEQIAQARSVGIHAVGFQQQRHAAFLRQRDQLAQLRGNNLVVHVAVGRRAVIPHHADIGTVQLLRQMNIVLQLREVLLSFIGELQHAAAG